jgi:hypothetical protein
VSMPATAGNRLCVSISRSVVSGCLGCLLLSSRQRRQALYAQPNTHPSVER